MSHETTQVPDPVETKFSRRTLLKGATAIIVTGGSVVVGYEHSNGSARGTEPTDIEQPQIQSDGSTKLKLALSPEEISLAGQTMVESPPEKGISYCYPFPHFLLTQGSPDIPLSIGKLVNPNADTAIEFIFERSTVNNMPLDERAQRLKDRIDRERASYIDKYGPSPLLSDYPTQTYDNIPLLNADTYTLKGVSSIRPNDERQVAGLDIYDRILAQNALGDTFSIVFTTPADIGKEEGYQRDYGLFKNIIVPTIELSPVS